MVSNVEKDLDLEMIKKYFQVKYLEIYKRDYY